MDHFDREYFARAYLLAEVHNAVATFAEGVQDAEAIMTGASRVRVGGVDATVEGDDEGDQANPLVLRGVRDACQTTRITLPSAVISLVRRATLRLFTCRLRGRK